MSKHTKGPWIATRSDPAEGSDVWWITACPAANQETELATVAGGYQHERHEANARLIAAAPDLLAMCEELAECSDYWSEYDVPIGLAERLRDVIAKAKGEA